MNAELREGSIQFRSFDTEAASLGLYSRLDLDWISTWL